MPLDPDIAQEIILDHSRHPRHLGRASRGGLEARGHNPLCGDEVRVSVYLSEAEPAVILQEAQGCALCRASASIMAASQQGKTKADMLAEVEMFCQGLASEQEQPWSLEELGDAAALLPVRQNPARVKCVTLAWRTLEAALRGRDQVTTE